MDSQELVANNVESKKDLTVVGCWLSEIGVSTMPGSGSSICSCAFPERVTEAGD